MPTKYTPEMSGEQILAAAKANVAEARQTLAAARAREDWPVEYRRAQRNAAVAVIEGTVRDAQQAFSAWANRTRAEAEKRLRAPAPVGSPAEESRRVARELELNRLIDSGRASGTPRNVAKGYAETALAAYLDGDYHRAVTYGTAASALGDPAGQRHAASAQSILDLDDPAKAQAAKDVQHVERGLMTFGRDVNAALADTYTVAAEAAREVGDDHRRYARQAVGPSMTAKALALGLAERDAEGRVVAGSYAAPDGTLASGPQGALRPTDGMIDALTSRTA